MEILNRLRSCAVCQSFIPPVDWLCLYCLRRLEKTYLPGKDIDRKEPVKQAGKQAADRKPADRKPAALTHLRLFDWRPDNHALVRPFLMSLKRVRAEAVFQRLALDCFSRFVHFPIWRRAARRIFVPAPPSLPSAPDHALSLARALAACFSGEAAPVLKREAMSPQKGKTRLLRSQIRFSIDGSCDLSALSADTESMDLCNAGAGGRGFDARGGERPAFYASGQNGQEMGSASAGAGGCCAKNSYGRKIPGQNGQEPLFVFTDDILTTGWTAREAYKALNRPKNFVICTLAFRVQAAEEASPFLLLRTKRQISSLQDSAQLWAKKRFCRMRKTRAAVAWKKIRWKKIRKFASGGSISGGRGGGSIGGGNKAAGEEPRLSHKEKKRF